MPTSPRVFQPTPLSILIVDDFLTIRQLLEVWLVDLGCRVICAESGREASTVLRTHGRIDLVITDIVMSDGDGFDVIREVKQAQPGARILAISGGGAHLENHDALQLAQRMGAHALLLKPFNREQLFNRLEMIWPVMIDQPVDGAAN